MTKCLFKRVNCREFETKRDIQNPEYAMGSSVALPTYSHELCRYEKRMQDAGIPG